MFSENSFYRKRHWGVGENTGEGVGLKCFLHETLSMTVPKMIFFNFKRLKVLV